MDKLKRIRVSWFDPNDTLDANGNPFISQIKHFEQHQLDKAKQFKKELEDKGMKDVDISYVWLGNNGRFYQKKILDKVEESINKHNIGSRVKANDNCKTIKPNTYGTILDYSMGYASYDTDARYQVKWDNGYSNWVYCFEVDILDEVEESMKLKENILDFSEVVKDSWNHIYNDLGKTPSIEDIMNDIVNNYEGYEDEDSTPEKANQFYRDIMYELRNQDLEYSDLDEVYQDDIILDEDIKEREYNVVIDNIEWSAENEDLPSSIQHDFFLSPYEDLEDEVYRFLLQYSNGVAPLGYSIDYNSEDYYIKDNDFDANAYIDKEDKIYYTEALNNYDCEIREVPMQALIYEYEEEVDIPWLEKTYNIDIDYDNEDGPYTIKGSKENITKFFDDHHLDAYNLNIDESLKEDFDDEDYWLPEENPLDDRYDYIDSKEVMDSDGFYTEYTMYYDTLENRYVFVFGDSDIYKPEDEDFDWECETRDEAEAWFNAYNGFEDDLDESLKDIKDNNIAYYKSSPSRYYNSINKKNFTIKGMPKNLLKLVYEDGSEEIKKEKYFKELLDKGIISKTVEENLKEDTIKQNGKWVNKGKEGTHGTFKTKKQADAQRKAMFANGYKEGLEEDYFDDKEYITLPEDEQKQFEDLMEQNGWLLDDETSRYGSKRFYSTWCGDKYPDAKDIHYQFITQGKYSETSWDSLMDDLYDLLDECEKEFNTRIRFSAGLINDGSEYDGRGTVGIDIEAPELIVNGEDKIRNTELAGHKIRLKNGKPYGKESEDVIKDIEDHGFDLGQMGIKKKDESLKEDNQENVFEVVDKYKGYDIEKSTMTIDVDGDEGEPFDVFYVVKDGKLASWMCKLGDLDTLEKARAFIDKLEKEKNKSLKETAVEDSKYSLILNVFDDLGYTDWPEGGWNEEELLDKIDLFLKNDYGYDSEYLFDYDVVGDDICLYNLKALNNFNKYEIKNLKSESYNEDNDVISIYW